MLHSVIPGDTSDRVLHHTWGSSSDKSHACLHDGTFGISLLHIVSIQPTWFRHSHTQSSDWWCYAGETGLARLRWRLVLKSIWHLWSQLDTHLTSSRPTQPTHQPFSAAASAPFPNKQRFLTSDLQTSGCLSTTEQVFLLGLHYPEANSFCGSTRSYLGSHKPQVLENCSPAFLPALRPRAEVATASLLHAWEGKGGDRLRALGKLAALTH